MLIPDVCIDQMVVKFMVVKWAMPVKPALCILQDDTCCDGSDADPEDARSAECSSV